MATDKRPLVMTTSVAVAAGLGLVCVFMTKRKQIIQRLRYLSDYKNPLRHRQIEIIDNAEDCHRVVSILKRQCDKFKVLGFDCEWVTTNGNRRPTALLQLASENGLCALFRLSSMKSIPKSLRDLLEDERVIKVGVGPQDDANNLIFDYSVCVASTLDLRFLAQMSGHKPEGLGKLSQAFLNVTLDKHWRISCSDWEAPVLSERQLLYAANDALVGIEIFKKLLDKLEPRNFWQFGRWNFEKVYQRFEPFLDVRFREECLDIINAQAGIKATGNKKLNFQIRKSQTRGISTRSKVLYDNCELQAPDGELLCTIDRKKAKWYVDENLGSIVKSEPLTVRLNFEPAGRSVGEHGRYYQTPKDNKCVVCGRSDAYLRKNVVPREYRKHFPDVMKSHTSHDVLLLCPNCHQVSNISDIKVRTKLARMCDAPLGHEERSKKYTELSGVRSLKSAARALLLHGDKIPAEKRATLRRTVENYYGSDVDITLELLQDASTIQTLIYNANYCQHGEVVTRAFETKLGGLIELEKLWRKHFLQTMKPKFLPKFWNVNHNADRLEVRALQGRVGKEDLIAAGLNQIKIHTEKEELEQQS